jgi:hypothetical protein
MQDDAGNIESFSVHFLVRCTSSVFARITFSGVEESQQLGKSLVFTGWDVPCNMQVQTDRRFRAARRVAHREVTATTINSGGDELDSLGMDYRSFRVGARQDSTSRSREVIICVASARCLPMPALH